MRPSLRAAAPVQAGAPMSPAQAALLPHVARRLTR
jgi:hypothetical protein